MPPDPDPEEIALRIAAIGPMRIEATAFDAFTLVAQLQLALRHPENDGPAADVARRLAQRLQSQFARDPVLAAMLEAGWDASLDS